MKIIKSYKLLIIVAMFGLLLVGGSVPKSSIRIEGQHIPLAANVKILNTGDTVTVKIYSEQVTDMYGYQFKLNYDANALEYQSLRTSIPEISLVFGKQFQGYLLVGATKIGDNPGYTYSGSEDVAVCEAVFRAKKDGVSPNFTLGEVNTVDSLLNYVEDVENWDFNLA